MDHYIDIKNSNFTTTGVGSKLSGEFSFTGTTRLASHVEGQIEMLDDSRLIIEREGKAIGKVRCHDLDIHGVFEGTIQATGRVKIFATGIVIGEIETTNLNILPGARVDANAHTLV